MFYSWCWCWRGSWRAFIGCLKFCSCRTSKFSAQEFLDLDSEVHIFQWWQLFDCRHILSQSLLVSSILLPISFKESKYSVSMSSAVGLFLLPPLLLAGGCSFLLHPATVFSASHSVLSISVCSVSLSETSVEDDVSVTFPLVVLRYK